MAKIDIIREKILNEVLSLNELENIMSEFKFHLIETDGKDENVVKFTNYSSQIWIYIETDDTDVLITKVSRVNRLESEQTKVDPFHSYEDLMKVMDYFIEKKWYKHWFIAWMMVSIGRRVGDTVALKWSDLYRKNGQFRTRLTQLREEKTGKKLSPVLNELARNKIEKYIEINRIKPMEHYDERIVSTSSAAFRKATKKAVDDIGFDYPISTHSYRKYYSSINYLLHQQESDCLMIIQTMMGHSDIETTKTYIGLINNKQDRYNQDFSNYIITKENGKNYDISNSPIVTIKAEDFRKLLSECFDMGVNGEEKFESINKLIKEVENLIV